MIKKGFLAREDWQDNSYGVDKNDYDNEIDYMEAIEEAISDLDEGEYEFGIEYEDDFAYDEEDEDFYYEDEDDDF